MASTAKQPAGKTGAKKKDSLIDPIYQKYTKSVIRALGCHFKSRQPVPVFQPETGKDGGSELGGYD